MIAGVVMAALLFVGAPGSAGDDGGPTLWVDQYTTFGCAPGAGDPAFADRVQPDRTKRLNQVIADCPEELWGSIVTSRAARVDVTQDQLVTIAGHANERGIAGGPDESGSLAGPVTTDAPGEHGEADGGPTDSSDLMAVLVVFVPALMVVAMVADVVIYLWRARRSAATAGVLVASAPGHEEIVPTP